jgi:hypothetical protein
MLWKVPPAIPLNPSDRNALTLYHINVDWFDPINGRPVLGLEAREIDPLIPPDRHVRRGKPFLQQREVRTHKLAE